MNVFKMAWRNIWRNRRRTLVTLAAMTLALWVMILYSGLLEGFLRDLEQNLLDLELGDVQIFAPDYRRKPSIYNRIDSGEAWLEQLERAGLPASARLLGGGLAAGNETSAGISIRGLDPVRDENVSGIYRHLRQGLWLDGDHPREVVLGGRLAKTLAVKPGDEVVVLSQAADGSMANDLFVVRGVLQGIADATDRTGLFMTAQAYRDFFNLPEGVHQIIVRRPAGMEPVELARTVREIAPDLDVKTWRELMPTMASMLDSSRGMIYIMFVVVYVAIAILILNAMLMSVFERIREFGVLKALGFGPKRVMLLIFTESAVLTGLSVGCGLVLSWPGLWYLTEVGIDTGILGGMNMMGMAFNPVWRAVVSVKIFVGPVATLLAIVAAAVIYPALKAARVSPVEAMRHL
jgi:ABC-type lipoprotein release transport system permease subunit